MKLIVTMTIFVFFFTIFGCSPTGSAPIITNLYLTDYQYEVSLTEFTLGDAYYYGFTVTDEDMDATSVKTIKRSVEAPVDWISIKDVDPISLPDQNSITMNVVVTYGIVLNESSGWAPGIYSFAVEVTDAGGNVVESDPVEFTILAP